jgi:hypothetical protein
MMAISIILSNHTPCLELLLTTWRPIGIYFLNLQAVVSWLSRVYSEMGTILHLLITREEMTLRQIGALLINPRNLASAQSNDLLLLFSSSRRTPIVTVISMIVFGRAVINHSYLLDLQML